MSTQCNTNQGELSIQELEGQLEEAKKALVDRKYVKYQNPGHLFMYDIDFSRFLEDISHILNEVKKLPDEKNDDNYFRA